MGTIYAISDIHGYYDIMEKTLEQVDEEIKTITQELHIKALNNFYELILNNRIEIINNEQDM